MQNTKVVCPNCGKRLFDVSPREAAGTVIIKCPRCKTMVSVDISSRASESNTQRQASAK